MGLRAYVRVRVLAIMLFGVIMMVMFAVPASAADILYDNGPLNGNLWAWTIANGVETADSFTLSAPSILTGVNFGEWMDYGAVPISVDWAIVTSLPAGWGSTWDVTGTTAPLTNAFQFTNSYDFDVYWESFSLPSVSLGSGTYYLVLQTAQPPTIQGDGTPAWDVNNGRSAVWVEATGNVISGSGWDGNADDSGSNSFQIWGTTSSTPEPATLTLLGSGLIGLGMLRKRRQQK